MSTFTTLELTIIGDNGPNPPNRAMPNNILDTIEPKMG